MKMRMRMMYKEEKKRFWNRIKGGKEIFTKQMALENIYIYRWLVIVDWFKNITGNCVANVRQNTETNLIQIYLNGTKRKGKAKLN